MIWPLPALLAWGLAWLAFAGLTALGMAIWVALAAGTAVGAWRCRFARVRRADIWTADWSAGDDG